MYKRQLRYRLEGMGYLPDEYLFMDREWANGREIPRGAEIFCITDYGGSEGIYTDISLRWYQDGKSIIESLSLIHIWQAQPSLERKIAREGVVLYERPRDMEQRMA